MSEMFDRKLRALRRDRSARQGTDRFLLERSFDDCLERLEVFDRRFDRALMLGCPDAGWRGKLGPFAAAVDVVDPGALFAIEAGGRQADEDTLGGTDAAYDLIVAIGTLDTANDLQLVLRLLHRQLAPGGLFLGAMSGGETLPRLRGAMQAADRLSGRAVPRFHPRIEASMLAPLLDQAGFVRPVVDVDRVRVAYSSLASLVRDLRSMAATNILSERSRTALNRTEMAAAIAVFEGSALTNGKVEEVYEILHFAAWNPILDETRSSPR